MATTVVENRHYYAFCRDCPYTGPLRFRRELAELDAVQHRQIAQHDRLDPPTETDRDETALDSF